MQYFKGVHMVKAGTWFVLLLGIVMILFVLNNVYFQGGSFDPDGPNGIRNLFTILFGALFFIGSIGFWMTYKEEERARHKCCDCCTCDRCQTDKAERIKEGEDGRDENRKKINRRRRVKAKLVLIGIGLGFLIVGLIANHLVAWAVLISIYLFLILMGTHKFPQKTSDN